MIESFFVRLQARRPEFSSAFSFAFGVLAPGAVWNCFRFGFAMLLIGRCQRFALSLFCFCFCFSLPLCVMPALYKSFAICFALFSARAVSAGRSPFRACRMADFVSRAGLSVLFSLFFVLFPCAEARFVQVVRSPLFHACRSHRFRLAPFRISDTSSSPTRSCLNVIPLPTEKRDPVRFRNGPLRLAEESIASARTGMSGARLFSERYRPAMRRTGFSLSAGVRPRTA